MDVLGLLAAAVAVVAFPGGAFTVAAAGVAARLGRMPPSHVRWPAPAYAATVLVVAACALLPLPGSPALHLPTGSGAPANLLGILLLLGAAVVLVASPQWPWARLLAAMSVALPLLVLAAAAATFDVTVVVGLPGRAIGAARALAAVALLVGAPHLAQPGDLAVPRTARAVLLAAAGLLATALAVPGVAPGLPGAAVAVIALGVAAGLGLLTSVLGPRAVGPRAAALAAAAGAASVVFSVIAAR